MPPIQPKSFLIIFRAYDSEGSNDTNVAIMHDGDAARAWCDKQNETILQRTIDTLSKPLAHDPKTTLRESLLAGAAWYWTEEEKKLQLKKNYQPRQYVPPTDLELIRSTDQIKHSFEVSPVQEALVLPDITFSDRYPWRGDVPLVEGYLADTW